EASGGAVRRLLRAPGGPGPRAADVRLPVPHRALAAGEAQRSRPALRRPVRALRRPARDRQRVLRAERPGRPAGALRRPARRAGRRGHGGPREGRGLRARAGIRQAADRRGGNRHRTSGHAAHRGHLDPRGDPLPAAAPGAPAMSWELMVGVRYLRSRRRAFLSLISALSLAGVTIGVATLLIV